MAKGKTKAVASKVVGKVAAKKGSAKAKSTDADFVKTMRKVMKNGNISR